MAYGSPNGWQKTVRASKQAHVTRTVAFGESRLAAATCKAGAAYGSGRCWLSMRLRDVVSWKDC